MHLAKVEFQIKPVMVNCFGAEGALNGPLLGAVIWMILLINFVTCWMLVSSSIRNKIKIVSLYLDVCLHVSFVSVLEVSVELFEVVVVGEAHVAAVAAGSAEPGLKARHVDT